MIKIIEYEDKYKDAVIDLWIQICIEEFGFEAWENGIRNMENHEFPKNNGKFLLAIENDELIGTISLKDIGMPQGMLKGFYVRSDYRSISINFSCYKVNTNFSIFYIIELSNISYYIKK